MKKSRVLVSALVLSFVALNWSQAQVQFVLDRSTFGTAGGEIAGSGYRLTGTGGQTAVGSASQSGIILMAGFWSQAGSTVAQPPATPALALPVDRTQNAAVNVTLSWFRSAGATTYRLQVSTVADFSSTVVDDVMIADTLKSIGPLLTSRTYYWRVSAASGGATSAFTNAWSFTTIGASIVGGSLTLSDGAGGTQSLLFGIDPSASDGIDASLGEVEQPPVPPSGSFDARFIGDDIGLNLGQGLRKDYRMGMLTASTVKIHEIRYQVGSGTRIIIGWDFSASAVAITGTLQDLITGSILNVSMSGVGSYTVTNPGTISKLKMIVSYGATMKDVTVNSGWNIVSVPLQATDMAVSACYPDASSPAYGFNNGYSSAALLAPGKGYWVKFPAMKTYRLAGAAIRPSTIAVNAGWNIIGALDFDVATSSVTSTPSGIISSPFYGYSNGYTTATTFNCGRGYWVKTSQAGILNLQSPSGKLVDAEVKPTSPTTKAAITLCIEDNGGRKGMVCLADGAVGEELPPTPPQGAFDVRFSGNVAMEPLGLVRHTIILSSVEFPVTLTANGIGARELWLNDGVGGSILDQRLVEGTPIVIHQKLASLVLEEKREEVPTRYELDQNYPNPFNPTTVIRFALPEGGHVRLAVYDVLGEVVAELVNGEIGPGQHQAQFNAAAISSGIYVYRLEAGGFVFIKKLVVVK